MTSIRWRVRWCDATASTNDDVRRAAEAGEPEGLVFAAKRQTAGRGRQGRVWESPEGNLYCSVLLRPKDMPRDAGLYSFVATLAVHDAVAAVLPGVKIRLKWPNDVLVNGKKISGILLELAGDALIVGVGLNVLHHPENAMYPATSLRAELAAASPSRLREGLGVGQKLNAGIILDGCPPSVPPASGREALTASSGQNDLSALLDEFLRHLNRWHTLMQSEGFAPVRAAWAERAQRGRLTVRLPQETMQGEFGGIDGQGRLRLLLEDGAERFISTGDVLGIQGSGFGIREK